MTSGFKIPCPTWCGWFKNEGGWRLAGCSCFFSRHMCCSKWAWVCPPVDGTIFFTYCYDAVPKSISCVVNSIAWQIFISSIGAITSCEAKGCINILHYQHSHTSLKQLYIFTIYNLWIFTVDIRMTVNDHGTAHTSRERACLYVDLFNTF